MSDDKNTSEVKEIPKASEEPKKEDGQKSAKASIDAEAAAQAAQKAEEAAEKAIAKAKQSEIGVASRVQREITAHVIEGNLHGESLQFICLHTSVTVTHYSAALSPESTGKS